MMSAFGDDSYIANEEIQELQLKIKDQDLQTSVNTIQEYLKEQDCVELNIGVTGESGSGKSSFVNAFRGLGDKDEGSAKTGAVETTMKPEVYLHPKYENVKLWDLPGIGTPNFKAKEYLKQVQFELYDFFIIIASDRFRECHTQLAKEIMRMKKNFYFVRSKIDQSIANEKKSNNIDEQETINIIRKDCEEGLMKIGIEDPVVFLISKFELGKYDFNDLQGRMEKELPQHKRRVLMLALPNITLEINEKKKKALRENIHHIAFLSAGMATVPVPFLSLAFDLAIIANEIKRYCDAFGLDEATLQQLCKNSGKSIETVEDLIESLWCKGSCTDLLVYALQNSSLFVTEDAVESIFRFIPVIGSIAAAGLSYLTVTIMLRKALNDIAEDARKVLMALLDIKA